MIADLPRKRMALDKLIANPANPREITDAALTGLQGSLDEFGLVQPVIWNERSGLVVGGHQRLVALRNMGVTETEVIVVDLPPAKEQALLLALNNPLLQGTFTQDVQELLDSLWAEEEDLLKELRLDELAVPEPKQAPNTGSLVEAWGAPPFSVLDSRQGYWRERKRAWLATGIKSELGRGEVQASMRSARRAQTGKPLDEADSWVTTSVFDPVLCELMYRWFCPPGGAVLDPFAGGSVRGVVAAMLGRHYVGIDLREEQVYSNRAQWDVISGQSPHTTILEAAEAQGTTIYMDEPGLQHPEDYVPPVVATCDPCQLTPVERRGEYLVKRDDVFQVAGVAGGKVRTCLALASAEGVIGLTTAGSRQSPQVNIVAHVAQHLGIPCRVHVPSGAFTPEMEAAKAAGADVVQHKPGHNSVIKARARQDAADRGYLEIPFGMECEAAITETVGQVYNLPFADFKRLVVPVGSGMSLAAILWGVRKANQMGLFEIVGVRVGADPTKLLDKYAPDDWADFVTLVQSDLKYSQSPEDQELEGLQLDPIYEAKCLPYLEHDDLLWVVGIRQTAQLPRWNGIIEPHPTGPRVDLNEVCEPPEYSGIGKGKPDPTWLIGDALEIMADEKQVPPGCCDMVFTCPPYADMERYSDDPKDLSTMDHGDFMQAYWDAIHLATKALREPGFAVVVIGNIRKPDGSYLDLVSATCAAFQASGLSLYNEAIYVTPAGTLPVRTAHQFPRGRKLGKTHQQVLVFVKGDPQQVPPLSKEDAATVDLTGMPDGAPAGEEQKDEQAYS